MEPSTIPKGRSTERNTDGRPINAPGIYVHKDTGAQFITSEGEEGVTQADALMTDIWKGAWERKGDVPSRVDILAMRKAQLLKDAKTDAADKKAEEAEIKAAVDKLMENEAKATPDLPPGGEVFDPEIEAKQ